MNVKLILIYSQFPLPRRDATRRVTNFTVDSQTDLTITKFLDISWDTGLIGWKSRIHISRLYLTIRWIAPFSKCGLRNMLATQVLAIARSQLCRMFGQGATTNVQPSTYSRINKPHVGRHQPRSVLQLCGSTARHYRGSDVIYEDGGHMWASLGTVATSKSSSASFDIWQQSLDSIEQILSKSDNAFS